jgi:hypothetical protein
MSEIHELMIAIEARIKALEQEKVRLQDHLEVLNQAEQIRLEFGGTPRIVEIERSEAQEGENLRTVEKSGSDVREYGEKVETVKSAETIPPEAHEDQEDESEEKSEIVETEHPEAKETLETAFDLLRRKLQGDGR